MGNLPLMVFFLFQGNEYLTIIEKKYMVDAFIHGQLTSFKDCQTP